MLPRRSRFWALLASLAGSAVWFVSADSAPPRSDAPLASPAPPPTPVSAGSPSAAPQCPPFGADSVFSLADSETPDFLRALPADLIDTPTAAEALARWAAHDPAAALAWLATLDHPPSPLLVVTLRAWLIHEPDTLRQHLAALPASPWKQRLLAHAGRLALQQNHPADAVAWLAELGPEHQSEAELLCAVGAWGRLDLASALEWAVATPDQQAQESRLAAALVGRAAAAPSDALDLALGLLDAGALRDHALAELVAEWARLDPAAAAEALERLPAGDARAQALSSLLTIWHDYDPAAAHAWVRRAPTALQISATSHLERLALGH